MKFKLISGNKSWIFLIISKEIGTRKLYLKNYKPSTIYVNFFRHMV